MLSSSPSISSVDVSLQILYKRIKHPRITIRPDLSISVSVPLYFTPLDAQRFIHVHQSWINRALEKLKARADSLSRELQAHQGEILLFGVWTPLLELFLDIPPSHRSSNQSQHIKLYLKSQLQAYLIPQVAHYARSMGTKVTETKITNALSRFGSCTQDNRLFFSLMLVFSPRELIDYVIIHELAHIRHKNHSRAFWLFVESHCPDWKPKRALLRQQARIYPFLLQRLES